MLSKNEQNALNEALRSANFQRLEDLAKQAVSTYPQEASAYYYLAEAYFLKKKWDNAALCLVKAIELEPDNTDYILRLARQKELEGAAEDANLLYRKAYAITPNKPAVIIALVKYYLFEEEDTEAADLMLEEGLKAFPEHATLLYLKAQQLKIDEDNEDALEYLDKSLAVAASEAAFVSKINLLIQANEQEAVIKTQQQLIAYLDKEGTAYQVNFAQYLMSVERFEEAIPILQQLSQNTRYQITAQEMLALAYKGQGQYKLSIEQYTQLLQGGQRAGLLISRAEAYQANEQIDAAIEDYETALGLLAAEDRYLTLEQLGHLYYSKGLYHKSIEQYKPLTKLDWYAKSAYFYLGKAYYAAQMRKEAFEMLQQAVKRKHPQAAQFLQQHFAAQMQQVKMHVLQKNKTAFSNNAASPLLQGLFGKFCRVDVFKNTFESNTPRALIEAVQTALADTFYVFSDQGIFCYNNIDKLSFCSSYRIIEEDADDVLLEVIELDKSGKTYQLNISFEEQTVVLEPQKYKANPIVLKCIDTDKLSKNDQKLLRKYASKEDLEFLGAGVHALIQQAFAG